MLQRYDLARDDRANHFSIKEFAVLETKSHKRNDYIPVTQDYSLIHEVSYDSDIIRAAIQEGREALISVLRSGDFFPVNACVEIIADSVSNIFNGTADASFEIYFDDRSLLSTFEKE